MDESWTVRLLNGSNGLENEFVGVNSAERLVPLGKTDLMVSPLGLGAWAWGDKLYWSYGRGYSDTEVRAAFDISLQAGINWVDTAEAYGSGRSERFLGKFVAEANAPVLIATKFMPFPWRLGKGALRKALQRSLDRLGVARVDLYQIHFPFPPVPVETWADALADAVQDGLVRAVGVSNYSEEQMRRTYAVLAKRGIPLASNQVLYNLLDRKAEQNGLMKTCQELNIALIAYSPLVQGLLTGKYDPDRPPPGIRGRRYPRSLLERVQPLIWRMREIGQEHGGKSPTQVALNWLICKGTFPIPGAKNARQAQENAGALGWRLSEAEVIELANLSERV
jgi:aryl-alcohol dehydrogenase-like predicted oxidoreductase